MAIYKQYVFVTLFQMKSIYVEAKPLLRQPYGVLGVRCFTDNILQMNILQLK